MTVQFSIVIPTHDRPNLVTGAVQSALNQTHGDFEVVVCDNSSDSRTREVLEPIDDPRLRVVSTSRVLPMHESWTFALSQARGQWTTYLCDDDAACSNMLARLDAMIHATGADVLCWRMAFYGYPQVFDPAQRDRLRIGAYSDCAREVDTAQLIEDAYDMRITLNDVVPRMLNTAVSRAVITRAGARGIRFFRPSCPDYSAMLAMAIASEKMVFLDAPLSIGGLSPQSIGTSSLNAGDAAARFIEQVLDSTPDIRLLPCMTGTRMWIAQTYLQCASEWEALAGRSPNLARAYQWALHELSQLERDGHDVVDARLAVLDQWCNLTGEQPSTGHAGTVDTAAVESDAFLGNVVCDESVLGLGPFVSSGGIASALGFDSLPELALRLPDWLFAHAARAERLFDALQELAHGRQVVLFGMGHQGRVLLRMAHQFGHSITQRLQWWDDAARTETWATPRADSLQPDHQLVVITPFDWEGIAARLEQDGFVRGQTWVNMEDACAMAQQSPMVSHSA